MELLHQQLAVKEQQLRERDEVRECLVEREAQKGEAKAEKIQRELREAEKEVDGMKRER